MPGKIAVLISTMLSLAACSGDTAGNAAPNNLSPFDAGSDARVDMGSDSATSNPDLAVAPDTATPAPDMGSATVAFQTGTDVETSDGPVAGEADGDLRVFKGIPFAEPPVGEFRFRPPQPNVPWTETLDATEFGPKCVQADLLNETNEDCLTLNVWAHTSDTPRPMMVWIHGGGFINGSGSDPYYDGAKLAENGDVVVVTINYRLGPLGYLALPELQAEEASGTVGNAGSLDQVEALRWIKTNAPAFGGDPENITIFGESAGGYSVCNLVGSPMADDLFDKAIVQSGGCNSAAALEDSAFGPSAFDSGAAFVARVGCDTADDVLACLRALDPTDFEIDAAVLGSLLEADVSFYPTLDNVFLSEMPFARITGGGAPNRPMILGSNGNEGALFTSQDVLLTRFDLQAKFEGLGLAPDAVARLMDTYDVFTFPLPKSAWDAFFGELFFNCNAYHTAVEAPFPTFAYHLMVAPASLSTLAGPLHVGEIPYVFGNFTSFAIIPTFVDIDMRDRVQAAWSSFARTGGPAFDPEWPEVETATPRHLEMGLLHSVKDEFRAGRCDVLREVGVLP